MDAVLGISLGTRHIGIAILINLELIDWHICSFSGPWSGKKLHAILRTIEQYIEGNQVERVAIKIPQILPSSYAFNQLMGSLNVLLENNCIQADYFTLSEIASRLHLYGRPGRKMLTEYILTKFPDLLRYRHIEKPKLFSYYAKVFEAVAAAYTLTTQIEEL